MCSHTVSRMYAGFSGHWGSCLVFVTLQPRRRTCCPETVSSCTCTIRRPWSSVWSTGSCTRTWASRSATTSSPPHTTPISWRISSKGPAARRRMWGNSFHTPRRTLMRSLQSAFGLHRDVRPRAAGCLWFVPVEVKILRRLAEPLIMSYILSILDAFRLGVWWQ